MLQCTFVLFIVTTSVQSGSLIVNSKPNSIDRLISDILADIDMNPYQVILFLNEITEQVHYEAAHIIHSVLREFPTITMHIDQCGEFLDFMDHSSISSPRFSTLFIHLAMFQDSTSYFSETNKLIDSYIEMFPRPIRPRWLMMLLSTDEYDVDNINRFLRESWQKLFLDLTIVEMVVAGPNHQVLIHNFNPFTDVHEAKAYTAGTPVFPDKLHDMNGYKLYSLFTIEMPLLLIECTESGEITSITGIDFWILEYAANAMNFSLQMKSTGSSSNCSNISAVYSALHSGDIDVGGNRVFLWSYFELEQSMLVKQGGICVIVPVLRAPVTELPDRFHYALLLTALQIIFLMVVSILLKFDRQVWDWINVFRVVFAFSIGRQPRSLKERMLFGCLLVLSIWYTTVFYARMTDNNLSATHEIPLRSFADLDRSGLIPVVPSDVVNYTFNVFANDSRMMSLKRKARIRDNPSQCVEELLNSGNVSCVMTESMGNYVIVKDRKDNGREAMRIMRPCFWNTWHTYAFAPGSPYPEKFDQVVSQIYESGIIFKWNDTAGVGVRAAKKGDEAETWRIMRLAICVVCVGCSLSFLAFLVELFT